MRNEAHLREFIIMVADVASSHAAKDLVVPKNMRLLRLPPYAPELNPQEHVWDELREKQFPNRVYADMASARATRSWPTQACRRSQGASESDRLALDR